MKPGGGKAKGSSFERSICKALSLWVSHGEREDLYWRSSISGGRATVARRKQKDLARHAGDITATHEMGHVFTDNFMVECKFVRTLGLANFIYGRPSPLRGFMGKAMRQAAEHGLEPLVIAKENNGPILVLIMSHEARCFSWAKESVIARIMWDAHTSLALLSFEQMTGERFTMRRLLP